MLDFLNENSGAFLVLFTFIVTFATVFYAIITAKLFSETKKMREAQTEPNIFLTIQSKNEDFFLKDMVIQNIGQGAAYNIKFELDSDFEFLKGRFLSKLNLIKNGLKYLAPNQKISFFIGSIPNLIQRKINTIFSIKIKYENRLGQSYENKYTVDFSEFFGMTHVGEPSLQKISTNLEKIQKDIHKMYDTFPKIKVITYSKKDIEEEQKEIKKYEKHMRQEQDKY
jgi:hypothetical protein